MTESTADGAADSLEEQPLPLRTGGLEVSHRASGGRHTLRLAGELDIYSVREFRRIVERATLEASELVLELGELSFVDSTGLRAILASRDACERNGCDWALVAASSEARRLFQLTGVLDILPFTDVIELEEALRVRSS